MKYGICVCGLNGSGKTTLASALAEELGFNHMDVEDYYFTSADNPYATARTREEVEELLWADIRQHPCFVFSAVNGNMTAEINGHYDLIIYLEVPLDIRMKRIRQRAVDKFGDKVLPGGAMYEQEEKFFAYAEKRKPDAIEGWLKTVPCRVIRLDGTQPVQENVRRDQGRRLPIKSVPIQFFRPMKTCTKDKNLTGWENEKTKNQFYAFLYSRSVVRLSSNHKFCWWKP